MKKLVIAFLSIIFSISCAIGISACKKIGGTVVDDNNNTQQGGNSGDNLGTDDSIYAITYLNLAFRNNGTEYTVYGLTNKGIAMQSISVPPSYDNIPITTIDEQAFANANSLESIHLPASIKSIGTGAFRNCKALRQITVAEGNARYKAVNNCLIDKSSDTLIAGCKNSKIPDDGSVTSIGMYAFLEQASEFENAIVIPEAVTEVKRYAFANSGITSLSVLNPNIILADSAFADCEKLEYLFFSTNMSAANIDSYAFNHTNAYIKRAKMSTTMAERIFKASVLVDRALKEIELTKGDTIPEYCFSNCTNLTTIVFPANLKTIEAHAFQNCKSLQSLNIPDTVTSVGESAFSDCTGLKSVEWSKSANYIPEGAFYGCTALTEFTVPENVTELANYTFCDCNLAKITISKNVRKLGCYSIGGTGCKIYYQGTMNDWCVIWNYDEYRDFGYAYEGSPLADGRELYIDGKPVIESGTLTIPGNVKKINAYTFYNVSGIKRLCIDKSVTDVSVNSFYGCENIEYASLSAQASKCVRISSLKEVEIVSGESIDVVQLSGWVSTGWISLERIFISSSITEIDNNVFNYCSNMSDIYYGGSEAEWENVSKRDHYDSNFYSKCTMHYNCTGLFDNVDTPEVPDKPDLEPSIPNDGEPQEFKYGDGTAANPYLISTAGQLVNIKNYPTACFKLQNDIVLDTVNAWNYNFKPLLSDDNMFNGTLDGNGHKIVNLKLYNTDTFYTGLFACIGQNGCVKNLTLEYVDISGTNYVGGIAGYSLGIIENCTVSGKIDYLPQNDYKVFVGGVVGRVENNIDKCITDTKITCSELKGEAYIGGMAGYLVGSGSSSKRMDISECSSNGDIICSNANTTVNVGGLVGYMTGYVAFNQVNTTGTLNVDGEGKHYSGGLVGCSSHSIINNSYTTGAITATSSRSGDSSAGGFIGKGSSTINNSYTTGAITATSFGSYSSSAGGFIGEGSSTINNSYTTGDITSGVSHGDPAYVGGLVGSGSTTISNSYTTGTITAKANSYWTIYAGGLVGYGSSKISSSYTVSKINVTSEGKIYSGALVGYADSFTLTNAHWLYYADSGVEYAVGYSNSMGIPSSIGATKHTDISDLYTLAEVLNNGLDEPEWENIGSTSLPTLIKKENAE